MFSLKLTRVQLGSTWSSFNQKVKQLTTTKPVPPGAKVNIDLIMDSNGRNVNFQLGCLRTFAHLSRGLHGDTHQQDVKVNLHESAAARQFIVSGWRVSDHPAEYIRKNADFIRRNTPENPNMDDIACAAGMVEQQTDIIIIQAGLNDGLQEYRNNKHLYSMAGQSATAAQLAVRKKRNDFIRQ